MEKRIRLNDYAVNVQFIQPQAVQNGPVLIFLHEALGSIVQWRQFPSLLCQQQQLSGLVIERRGHGQSDQMNAPRTKTYLHDYAEELHAVLEEVYPLGKSFILVGHSDGASIALIYASRYPKNVSAIISMAAHTFVENETLAGIPPAVAAFENGKLDGLKRIHGEKTDVLFYAWANIWQSTEFRDWDIREEIFAIRCPVLAIQGMNDQYGTPEQVTSIQKNVTQVTTAILPDCGHHPHLEKQADVLELTHNFLRKNKQIFS